MQLMHVCRSAYCASAMVAGSNLIHFATGTHADADVMLLQPLTNGVWSGLTDNSTSREGGMHVVVCCCLTHVLFAATLRPLYAPLRMQRLHFTQ